MKRKHLLLGVSVSMNLLLLVGATTLIFRNGGVAWIIRKITISNRSTPNNRMSVFQELPVRALDTVLLGDSIINLGEWHELLNDPHAKNRGISGDDTAAILRRISQITAGCPGKVVLLCGINDLQKQVAYAQTTENYRAIVKALCCSELWIISVLPVNEWLYQQWIVPDHPGIHMPTRHEVASLNAFIATLGHTRRVHFVDLRPDLANSGQLDRRFTDDGLHLSGRGLKITADRLRSALTVTGPSPQPLAPTAAAGLPAATMPTDCR